MRIELFDAMSECSDDAVVRMLPLVSVQRREQAMQYRFVSGRFACLKSYLMLQEMVGIGEPLTFGYGEYGKPYVIGHPEVHFSISHCPKAIAVAVGDKPVGIDVEQFHAPNDALLRRTMNDSEIDEIMRSGNRAEAFTRLWTQKEAIVKCLGTGIVDDLRRVRETGMVVQTLCCHDKCYVWSFCEKK